MHKKLFKSIDSDKLTVKNSRHFVSPDSLSPTNKRETFSQKQ